MLAYACAVAAASPLANRYIDLIENAVTGSLHDEADRRLDALGRRVGLVERLRRRRLARAVAEGDADRRALAAAAPERARARPLKADKPEHEQHTLSRCLNVMCGVSAA